MKVALILKHATKTSMDTNIAKAFSATCPHWSAVTVDAKRRYMGIAIARKYHTSSLESEQGDLFGPAK